MILVSILIPTYNQDEFILEAVNSALNQSYPNLEIIIGDDSSNDKTSKIVSKYITHKNVIYIKNESRLGRVGNYRNLHLKSRGEWAINLDGDDYFSDPDFIKKSVELIEKHKNSKTVIVCAKYHILSNNKLSPNKSRFDSIKEKSILLDGIDDFISNIDTVGSGHLTSLYKKSVAIPLNLYCHDILTSDSESIGRVVIQGKVIFLNEYVAVWRKHKQNASFHSNIDEFLNGFKRNELIFEEIIKKPQCDAIAHKFLKKSNLNYARRVFGRIYFENQLNYLDDFIRTCKTNKINFFRLFFKAHMIKKLLHLSLKEPKATFYYLLQLI